MTSSSFVGLLALLPAALLCFSCGDDGADGGSGGSSNAGSGSIAGGSSSGAANVAGAGGSSGAAQGGSSSGIGGSATGGSAGGGGGEVVWAYYGFCSPICVGQGAYCALVEVSCASGAQRCFEAECRKLTSCTGANDGSCPAPAACINDQSDDCEGVDCPGVCNCMPKACAEGMAFDERPEVCKCVPAQTPFVDCLDVECPTGMSCGEVFGTAACVKKYKP
jgi:hypothetical protein